MIEPFKLPALTLPVSDGVFDKLQLRGFAKISYRENGSEHGLEAGVFAFRGKQIHLKKAVVGLALDLDKVWDSDRRFDPGKIVPLSAYAVSSIC